MVSAVAFAAPAQADERSYINDLVDSPYNFTGNTTAYIAVGYGVCSLVRQGWTQDQVTRWVVANTGPGIYYPQAHHIVISAEVFLC